MPSKTITYEDMTVKISAPLFGGDISAVITCRGASKTLTQEELFEQIYPSLSILFPPEIT